MSKRTAEQKLEIETIEFQYSAETRNKSEHRSSPSVQTLAGWHDYDAWSQMMMANSWRWLWRNLNQFIFQIAFCEGRHRHHFKHPILSQIQSTLWDALRPLKLDINRSWVAEGEVNCWAPSPYIPMAPNVALPHQETVCNVIMNLAFHV